jgi:hypothetical protein
MQQKILLTRHPANDVCDIIRLTHLKMRYRLTGDLDGQTLRVKVTDNTETSLHLSATAR